MRKSPDSKMTATPRVVHSFSSVFFSFFISFSVHVTAFRCYSFYFQDSLSIKPHSLNILVGCDQSGIKKSCPKQASADSVYFLQSLSLLLETGSLNDCWASDVNWDFIVIARNRPVVLEKLSSNHGSYGDLCLGSYIV